MIKTIELDYFTINTFSQNTHIEKCIDTEHTKRGEIAKNRKNNLLKKQLFQMPLKPP